MKALTLSTMLLLCLPVLGYAQQGGGSAAGTAEAQLEAELEMAQTQVSALEAELTSTRQKLVEAQALVAEMQAKLAFETAARVAAQTKLDAFQTRAVAIVAADTAKRETAEAAARAEKEALAKAEAEFKARVDAVQSHEVATVDISFLEGVVAEAVVENLRARNVAQVEIHVTRKGYNVQVMPVLPASAWKKAGTSLAIRFATAYEPKGVHTGVARADFVKCLGVANSLGEDWTSNGYDRRVRADNGIAVCGANLPVADFLKALPSWNGKAVTTAGVHQAKVAVAKKAQTKQRTVAVKAKPAARTTRSGKSDALRAWACQELAASKKGRCVKQNGYYRVVTASQKATQRPAKAQAQKPTPRPAMKQSAPSVRSAVVDAESKLVKAGGAQISSAKRLPTGIVEVRFVNGKTTTAGFRNPAVANAFLKKFG